MSLARQSRNQALAGSPQHRDHPGWEEQRPRLRRDLRGQDRGLPRGRLGGPRGRQCRQSCQTDFDLSTQIHPA